MTAGDVVAIVIWCLPSAVAIWQSAREKRQALEWGPRPQPPPLSRRAKCPGCGAVFAHKPLMKRAPICRRCEEERA